jgi:hypothetical protein
MNLCSSDSDFHPREPTQRLRMCAERVINLKFFFAHMQVALDRCRKFFLAPFHTRRGGKLNFKIKPVMKGVWRNLRRRLWLPKEIICGGGSEGERRINVGVDLCRESTAENVFRVFSGSRKKASRKRTLSIVKEWSSFVYKWKHIIQSLRQDDCNKSVRKLLGFIYSDTHRETTFSMLFISVRFPISPFSFFLLAFNVSECWERPAGFASCIITSIWEPYRVTQYDIIVFWPEKIPTEIYEPFIRSLKKVLRNLLSDFQGQVSFERDGREKFW